MTDTYSVAEISRKLLISKGTAYNRLSAGLAMPPTIKVGRKRLFPVKEFEKWMAERIEYNDELAILDLKTGVKK
jgi:predicted DNA-binding transcriptional regulator AlpA